METTPAQSGVPTSDPGLRRPRTFQCKDALWESLEHVAGELECTVDFLLNDAIKQYLRHRQRTTQPLAAAPAPRPSPPGHPLTPPSQRRLAPPMPEPLFAPPPPAPPPLLPAFAPPPLAALPPLPPGFAPPPLAALPPLPPGFAPPLAVVPPPVPPPRPPAPPPLVPRAAPPPPPSLRTAPPPPPPPPLVPPASQVRLVVSYGHQSVEVERAGFIIGRGKQALGLTIKDPNISRCHATVEQRDGVYWLVDMGSTNGTLVNGQPIQRKPIADGDVARICDHEIRFSYRRVQ